MVKIKDFTLNQLVNTTLVITRATARKTKAGKPYLQLEMFDGCRTISGNYWDWTSGKIPEVNAIVDIEAQVTEYMGNLQLNVKRLSLNADKHLSDFAPQSNVNIGDIYREAYELATNIKDDFIRTLTITLLENFMQKWCSAPGAVKVHHAFVGGTLVHSVSVAKIALAVSKQIPESNNDLCVAGGLLHDIGKLYTYEMNGVTVDMTPMGKLYDHTFIGAELIGSVAHTLSIEVDEDKLMILRHIVLAHHGALEYGAAVPPQCIEAHIVHHADGIDAVTQQILESSVGLDERMFTERIYTLGNKNQLTPQYISNTMVNKEELPLE